MAKIKRNDYGIREEIKTRDGVAVAVKEALTKAVGIDHTTDKGELTGRMEQYNDTLDITERLSDKQIDFIVNEVTGSVKPIFDGYQNVIPSLLYDDFVKQYGTVYKRGYAIYAYDTTEGYYKPSTIDDLQNYFFDNCIQATNRKPSKAKEYSDYALIRSKNAGTRHDEKRYICFSNGVYDLEGDKLKPHSSEHQLETKFKYQYVDKSATFERTRICKFLREVMPKADSRRVLQESCGLVFSPHAREIRKAFIWYGERARNGKSALLTILENCFTDPNHVGRVPLPDYGEDFAVGTLSGKFCNIVRDDEFGGYMEVGKYFKSHVSGEPFRLNGKYQKQIDNVEFNHTLIFGLNTLPNPSDKTDGFYSRIKLIIFNTVFGDPEEVEAGDADIVADKTVLDGILDNPEEMESFIWWAMTGLKRAYQNKWYLSTSEDERREMGSFRRDTHSVLAFVEDRIKITNNPKDHIPVKEFNLAYRMYCADMNLKEMGGRGIKSYLKKVIRLEAFEGKIDHGATRVYRGLKMRDLYDETEDLLIDNPKKQQTVEQVTYSRGVEVSRTKTTDEQIKTGVTHTEIEEDMSLMYDGSET